MARKRFNGIRRRVEGERARFAVDAVGSMGFLVSHQDRLGDDSGYTIRTQEGPVINMYDTGTITVTGNNRHMFGDAELLRMPVSIQDVLIVANQDDEVLLRLTMTLQGSGLNVNTTFFSDSSWLRQVGTARRRGQHIVVLASAPSTTNLPGEQVFADPDQYFGLGLLIARLERDHLSVLWDEAVEMPQTYGFLGPNLIRYAGSFDSEHRAIVDMLARVGLVKPDTSGADRAA